MTSAFSVLSLTFFFLFSLLCSVFSLDTCSLVKKKGSNLDFFLKGAGGVRGNGGALTSNSMCKK